MNNQLTISFNIHQHENNALSQAHLELYKDKFSEDCLKVLKKLVNGEVLMSRSAQIDFLSGDLRARIRDLRNPKYGLGIPISDRWVKTGKSSSKEYFMTEPDKVEALKILINKLNKAA